MYWTTQTRPFYAPFRSPPLSTSPQEYILALRALMTLIDPLSLQLLPLFHVYNTARAAQGFCFTYHFSLDEEISQIELETVYAHIVLLLHEVRAHYDDFCGLYGAYGVGEVCEMVRSMGGEGEQWRGLPREWDDLRYLMEDEGLMMFLEGEKREEGHGGQMSKVELSKSTRENAKEDGRLSRQKSVVGRVAGRLLGGIGG